MTPTETARHIESLVTPFRRRARVEAAEALDRFHCIETAAQDAQRLLVAQLRDQGLTWAEVGALLGVTKQAAQQRYGNKRPAPTADPDQLTLA